MNSTRFSSIVLGLLFVLLVSCNKNETPEFTPVAKFSIINIQNENVEFRNNSLNSTSFLWDFGDGNTSTEKDPTHSYTAVGTYDVVLTAFLDDKSNEINGVVIVSKIFPESLVELSNPPFGSKSEALSFSWNDKGYVFAGTSNFQSSNGVWEFDSSNQTWKQLNDAPNEFNRAVCFVINDSAYMGLGQIPWGIGAFEFYKYDIPTDTYTSIGLMPNSSSINNFNWIDALAFTYQEKGYVMGSGGDLQENVVVMEFHPNDNNWLQKSTYPGAGKFGMFHFVLDGFAYIGMGNEWGFNGFNINQEVWQYDIANDSWTQLADFPNEGRRDAVGFTYNGKGYLAFGYNNDPNTGNTNAFGELWEYEKASDEWIRLESMPIPIIQQFYNFNIGNKFYFGGGIGVGNARLMDFYEYSF